MWCGRWGMGEGGGGCDGEEEESGEVSGQVEVVMVVQLKGVRALGRGHGKGRDK